MVQNSNQTLPSPHAAPAIPGIRFEVLRDDAGLRILEPHWDRLLAQSTVRTPFMSWDWTEIWWKLFEKDHRAVFGAAWTADGTLAALVPFMIGPGQTMVRRRFRHLSYFAGLGEVVAEGLDCMALPGHENLLPVLLNRVFEEIRGEWDVAQFGFVDSSSPFYETLRQSLTGHGEALEMTNPQSSAIIRPGEGGWDAYLKERSSNFRKDLRRVTATAEELHPVNVREADTTELAAVFMEDLLRLHAGRWPEEKSLFLSPRAKAFHRQLAARWCPAGRAVLLLMDFNGVPAAANYAFTDGKIMWDYQSGWNPDHIKLSPGKLMMAENYRRAFQRGISEIDLLPGNLDYKCRWAQSFREVFDLEAYNPCSTRGRVFHWVRAVKYAFVRMLPGKNPNP